MTEFISKRDPEYEAFAATHSKAHFCQSHMWSGVKKDWRWHGIICRNDAGEITGVMSLLVRRVPLFGSLIYAPRGPVCSTDDEKTMTQLLDAAEAFGKSSGAFRFIFDPDVEPDSPIARFVKSRNIRLRHEQGGFSNVQPQYVVRLELEGKTPQQLLSAMNPKTRYNIRLAQRKGVQVQICSKERLDDFQRLMEQTGLRDGFGIRNREYFARLLDSLHQHARLYIASLESEAIAGAIAVGYGDKTWYLYGASSNSHRSAMPNYLLQWNMILWALERGSRVYDFL